MNNQPFPIDRPVPLPAMGSWPQTVHVFDETSVYAIQAALAAQRPLLVRGEPGAGKSQLARAAAHVLKRLFVSEVVHAMSEAQDLQWHFDAVARLGEAQALGALGKTQQVDERLDPRRYLSPGALWWVFDWRSAEKQFQHCRHHRHRPAAPSGWKPELGSVLLIDEIDKAEADLPNGLLETLGNGAFAVPYLDQPVGLVEDTPAPLVVITTNEERELPGAFLLRCMVLQLKLPDKKEKFVEWLCARGESHFGKACTRKVRETAADQLWSDRQEAQRQGVTPPGQAEYLDMLRALSHMAKTEEEQLKTLDKISDFALKKFPWSG